MNNSSELLHNAFVVAFVLIGMVGLPGVLLLFARMAIGDSDEERFGPRR